MSASQRPNAVACRQHSAFRGLKLVDLHRSETGERSVAEEAVSTVENLNVPEQRSINGGLVTSDSISLVADRKHRSNSRDTETVNPSACACDELTSDYRYAQHQSQTERAQVVEASGIEGETSIDVRVPLRCRQAIQDTGGIADENTSSRVSLSQILNLNGPIRFTTFSLEILTSSCYTAVDIVRH